MSLLPPDIYQFLHRSVLGQDWSLKRVAVAIYKHLNGLPAGNIMLIGNSGTGKTTIMKALRRFYAENEGLEKFRNMIIINANMLVGAEPGDVQMKVLIRNLETEARRLLGPGASLDQVRELIENSTVCIDEIDKISARIAGKVNPFGIAVQQALLTILEGETVFWEPEGEVAAGKVAVDTGRMLFICGGAFEELYEQIFTAISNHADDRRFKESLTQGADGKMQYTMDFQLRDYLRLSDLFIYGMVPQFVSRFSALAVLNDLGKDELVRIMRTAPDSPYLYARRYFEAMDIELVLDDEAIELIALHAARTARVGARALRVVMGVLTTGLEFDPFSSGKLQQKEGGRGHLLRIDREMVKAALN